MTTADQLVDRGFVRVRNNVFLRVRLESDHVSGIALWRQDGGLVFAGARFDMALARRVVLRLAQLAATGTKPQRKQARRMLGKALDSGVRVAGDDTLLRDLRRLIMAFAGLEIGGRGRLLARLRKIRGRIQRLASRVAKNNVMQKLRRGYAKVLSGPVGKVAAKATGYGLSMFGVPPRITEAAIRAHQMRKSDRLRKGGWAGALATATGPRGLRGALRDEARRFGRGVKQSINEQTQGGGLSLDNLAKIAKAGKIGALVEPDELGW